MRGMNTTRLPLITIYWTQTDTEHAAGEGITASLASFVARDRFQEE